MISKPMKGRGYTEPFIGLRSERDKSVYFWSWGGYLLYNTIITRNKSKNLPCFPSKQKSRQFAILFILSTAAAILTQTNRMESPLCGYILL